MIDNTFDCNRGKLNYNGFHECLYPSSHIDDDSHVAWIMILNFIIVQAAPGGPVEQMVAKLTSLTSENGATARISSGGSDMAGQAASASINSVYRGARGLDPEILARITKMYGFDKPPLQRFEQMMGNYLRFDFGESFFRNESVLSLVWHTLPVTISLGLWTTLLTYMISIPLGIRKAVRDGSIFDAWTSWVIIIGYAIPSFLFAILLIIVFAGGHYLHWFPLKGLVSIIGLILTGRIRSLIISGISPCL